MSSVLILASGSAIRSALLTRAGVAHDVVPARVDEQMITQAMVAEGAAPRDIADTLAESKARKVSDRHPETPVLGCDQVLDHRGKLLRKAATLQDARAQLRQLAGDRHSLFSAGVLYLGGKPIWRHIGQVRLTMRALTDTYIDAYVARNWDSIRHAVGCYKLEEEGVRLFTAIEGDHFHVLGIPFLELLNHLTLRGDIAQ